MFAVGFWPWSNGFHSAAILDQGPLSYFGTPFSRIRQPSPVENTDRPSLNLSSCRRRSGLKRKTIRSWLQQFSFLVVIVHVIFPCTDIIDIVSSVRRQKNCVPHNLKKQAHNLFFVCSPKKSITSTRSTTTAISTRPNTLYKKPLRKVYPQHSW